MKTPRFILAFATVTLLVAVVVVAVGRTKHDDSHVAGKVARQANEMVSGSDATHGTADGPQNQGLTGTEFEAVMLKGTGLPDDAVLRLYAEDYVRTFSVTEHAISSQGKVLWGRLQERIGCVQESPDGTKLLFFNYTRNRYQVYRHDNGALHELDLEPPHRDQDTRVNGWFWVGNDLLIGVNDILLEPAPRGYEDEGWIDQTRFFLFDLRSKSHREVLIPGDLDNRQGGKKIIKDQFDPGYSYEIQLKRYYFIKGITNKGVILLGSLENGQPAGCDPRDEGWFVLEE